MKKTEISEKELKFLSEAAAFLETPSLVIRLSNAIGKPLEYTQKHLPEKVRKSLSKVVHHALNTALQVAINTINTSQKADHHWDQSLVLTKKAGWSHTATVSVTGAIGGFFGATSLPIELPLSTGIILRGIARSAEEWGFDLNDPIVKMQCLYIFTLGSQQTEQDNEMDSAYLTSRIAFAHLIREASKVITQYGSKEILRSVEKGTAPVLIRFIAEIAKFFEIAVTEKLLAEALPVLGAIGGATINAAFCDYFVSAARYHFGVVSLEEKYGRETIQKIFLDCIKKDPRDKANEVS